MATVETVGAFINELRVVVIDGTYLGLAEYIDRTWRSLGYALTRGEGKVQNKQVE